MFADFTGRWAEPLRLGPAKLVAAVRGFVDDHSPEEVARRCHVARDTAMGLFNTIRRMILRSVFEVEVADGRDSVMGLRFQDDRVDVATLDRLPAEVLESKTHRVRAGHVVYTNPHGGMDAVTFAVTDADTLEPHTRTFTIGRVYLRDPAGFWSYLKPRLSRHRGISWSRYPLYLGEYAYKFNNKVEYKGAVEAHLLSLLCSFRP